MQERSNRPDLEPQAISAFTQTFINRRDVYPIQLGNGAYVSVDKALRESLVYAHFKDRSTIGALEIFLLAVLWDNTNGPTVNS